MFVTGGPECDSSCHCGGVSGNPREGNGNPLQYSCLGNPMDWGAWQVAVDRVANESDMT